MPSYESGAAAGAEYDGPTDHAYRNYELEEYLGVGYAGDAVLPEDSGPEDVIPEEPPLNT